MAFLGKTRALTQVSGFALAAALGVTASFALPQAAQAQAEARQEFNIGAGDLTQALQAYSAATGIQLVYGSDLVAGKQTQGVGGSTTPAEALSRLLAGTGLTARIYGNSATLVPVTGSDKSAEGERMLGAVRVEGSQSSYNGPPERGSGVAQLGGVRGAQDEEARGVRPVVSSIASGAPTALEDIPRSITVLTQEQIEKQDVTDFADALKRLPGITIDEGVGTTAGFIYSRGLPVTTIQIDGGAPQDLGLNMVGNGLQSFDAYERVELVRGANGIYSGSGSFGGAINLVRKRPGTTQDILLEAAVGSWGRFDVSADFSTPNLFGTGIGFRTVVSRRAGEQFYDNYSQRNSMIYGIFDIPLGENARAEVGAEFNRLHVTGGYLPGMAGALAFGVTTMRDPLSSTNQPTYRDMVATGAMIGPRYFGVGPAIFRDKAQIRSAREAAEILRRHSGKISDSRFVKQYEVGVRLARQWVVMGAAKNRLSPTVEARTFYGLTYIVDGYAGIEHYYAFPSPLADDVIQLLAKSGTVFTPTTSLLLKYGPTLSRDHPKELAKEKRFSSPASFRTRLEAMSVNRDFGQTATFFSDYRRIIEAGGRIGTSTKCGSREAHSSSL